jgi:hypothetical protein
MFSFSYSSLVEIFFLNTVGVIILTFSYSMIDDRLSIKNKIFPHSNGSNN